MSDAPEQAARVATSLIDSLKSQPLLILVLMLNVIFIGVNYFGLEAAKSRQATIWGTVLERCLPEHDKR